MKHWPHAPPHFLQEQSIYMITGATYQKIHFFQSHERLQLLHDNLLALSSLFNWELHAWAVFSNHYHFVAQSPPDPSNLRTFISKLHHMTAVKINAEESSPNRKVWYQYWDSKITMHTSYLARLNYVHQNPVKHGLVSKAGDYPWCSAGQFERHASQAFVKSVYSFDYSKVKVFDEF